MTSKALLCDSTLELTGSEIQDSLREMSQRQSDLVHVNPLPLTLLLQGLSPLPGHLLAVLMEHNGKMPMDRF